METEDRDDKVRQVRSAVSSWRRLDKLGKQKSLKQLKLQLAEESSDSNASDGESDLDETDGGANATTSQESQDTLSRAEADSDSDQMEEHPVKVFENVHLFPSSSYMYYYPTMHWSMDKTPDSDDYWIGIYERGAPDDKYIAHHWIGMVAKGSFRVGKLETTAGKVGTNRTDVFELRMFNGSQRCLQAKTNNLVGSVLCTAVIPYSGKSLKTEEELHAKKVAETASCIQQVFDESEETNEAAEDQSNGGFMDKLKNAFSFHEKGKLLHRFEQEFLSDEITKKEDSVDRPEPKDEYGDQLGKSTLSKQSSGTSATADSTPSEIVLEISLNYSNMYVYPMLRTTAAMEQKKAWFGVYKANSNGDMKFDYKAGSLDSNKRLLRSSSAGETELGTLSEWTNTKPCTIDNQYVGVIFDVKPGHKKYTQVGLATTMIRASMYTTPAPDSMEFRPNFDVKLAKKCATLSEISYESDFDALKEQVAEMKLTTEMKIYDSLTDTDGFIASDSTTTMVVFRGTGTNKMQWTFTDMVTNFMFIPEPILPNCDSPKGHRGFVNSLNSVYDKIIAHLKPHFGKKRLIFTGHSLGASLASLFVYRLTTDYKELKSSVTLMTFACPPTGSSEFSEHFNDIDSNSITIQGDFFSSGWLIKSAQSVIKFYRPVSEKFLPFTGGHSIRGYVEQIENLSQD